MNTGGQLFRSEPVFNILFRHSQFRTAQQGCRLIMSGNITSAAIYSTFSIQRYAPVRSTSRYMVYY